MSTATLGRAAMACSWCRWAASHEPDDGETYVVATRQCGTGQRVVLVPTAHVDVLTDLPRSQVAAVLAGLARACRLVRAMTGAEEVAVQPGKSARTGHVYFEVAPVLRSAGDASHAGPNSTLTSRPKASVNQPPRRCFADAPPGGCPAYS